MKLSDLATEIYCREDDIQMRYRKWRKIVGEIAEEVLKTKEPK